MCTLKVGFASTAPNAALCVTTYRGVASVGLAAEVHQKLKLAQPPKRDLARLVVEANLAKNNRVVGYLDLQPTTDRFPLNAVHFSTVGLKGKSSVSQISWPRP